MPAEYKTKSFKIPSSLEIQIHKRIVEDGYGLRGKSKWMCDTLIAFLTYPDEEFILDAIGYAEELKNLDKSVSFRPTIEVENLLDSWVIKARIYNPSIEGVKSKIIRAAIMNALIRSIQVLKKVDVLQKEHIE